MANKTATSDKSNNNNNNKSDTKNTKNSKDKDTDKNNDSTSNDNTPSTGNPSTDDANLTKEEKLKRFENEGVEFKAKLIGSELVLEPRGDKMCQSSIQRLKAMVKGLNTHKKRLLLKISYAGVKVYDEKTNEILHHHEVPQISYIASDDTDNRTFGYVCDLPNKGHQFICFKTSGPAINVMSTISQLFEAVLEKKNKAEQELNEKKAKEEALKSSPSIDLVGDSGIMDTDLSFSSDINFSKQQASNNLQQHQQQTKSADILAQTIFNAYDNEFTGGSNTNWSAGAQPQQQQQHSQNIMSNPQQQQSTQNQNQYPFNQPQLQGSQQQQIEQNKQQQHQNRPNHQSSSASNADLLFSDLFFGLSDPIIVDNNDSLVTNKMPLDGSGANQFGTSLGSTGQQQFQNQQFQNQQFQSQQNFLQQQHHQQQQQQQQHKMSNASMNQLSFQQQQQQFQQRMASNSNINNNPFDPNSSINSNPNMSNSSAGIMRPRPSSSSMQAPQPIPPRTGLARQSTLNPPNSMMSPLSLPRPSTMMQEPANRHNRSLVHNHSSVSLSDAALTRQFSFNISPNNNQPISESYADRYSVFNDIDNLPSIFESTSLGNVNDYNQNQASMSMGGRNVSTGSRMSNMPGQQQQQQQQTRPNFNF